MFGSLKKLLLLLLVVLPVVITVVDEGRSVAYAQEDEVDGEEDDIIDDEEVNVDDGTDSEVEQVDGTEEEEEEEELTAKGSPDADTIIYFTKPVGTGSDLPAGKLVEFLVGFTNNGDKDFILDAIDASFRYPMDFNFYIQNFTAIPYNRAVKPRQEATVMYSFYPAEAFAGRPLGLTVNLAYHDADGNVFVDPVFNQTVNIVEVDEGMDGETFFLYIFMLAFAVLLLVAGHHFLSSFGRRRGGKRHAVEMGTKKSNSVDYDWLPKELLNEIKKSPRQSPRQRKAAREANSK
ncbi:translocon-associated protein subunit alpha-like [Penaeus japonicus]|uniref:translocon-associated protein subunit alpha-like n=1 Tax=Penaeus japonicus TaxID=27405 RepID=UPI001C712965|nr:translocon-associated protein subunit alpha-like [Penaeus japonicus]